MLGIRDSKDLSLSDWEELSEEFIVQLNSINFENFKLYFTVTRLSAHSILEGSITMPNAPTIDLKHPIFTGFEDIFYHYLLCKNFGISKEEIKLFIKLHMCIGRYTLKQSIDDYFNLLGVDFLKRIRQVFIEDRSEKRPVCGFYHSQQWDSFFEKCWEFIETYLSPFIRENYMKEGSIKEYINLSNSKNYNTKKQGEIALFHLGLLGKFQRGELQVLLNKD